MTVLVANVDITDTFDNWRNRTNQLSAAMSNAAVTVNSNTAVGNAAITGTFSANVVFVGNAASNVTIYGANSIQKSSGQYYLNANNSWVQFPGFVGSAATVGTSWQEVDNFLQTEYTAAEYVIRVKDDSVGGNNTLATKVLVFHDSLSTAYSTEYATIYSNNLISTFSANANTTHVRLWVSPTVANATVNFIRISSGV